MEDPADKNNVMSLVFVLWACLPLTAQTQADAIARQRAAIQKQAAAVHGLKEAATGAFFSTPWPNPPGSTGAQPTEITLSNAGDCDPIPQAELSPMIAGAAQKEKIDPRIVHRVIERESGFKPCAESPKGAMGLMQLMPSTANQLAVTNPWDPQQNIFAGAHYLKQLLDRYQGDLSLALGAYNAGPGKVDASGGVPAIPETQNYVNSIMRRLAIQ